jgi:hypothetical protein
MREIGADKQKLCASVKGCILRGVQFAKMGVMLTFATWSTASRILAKFASNYLKAMKEELHKQGTEKRDLHCSITNQDAATYRRRRRREQPKKGLTKIGNETIDSHQKIKTPMPKWSSRQWGRRKKEKISRNDQDQQRTRYGEMQVKEVELGRR